MEYSERSVDTGGDFSVHDRAALHDVIVAKPAIRFNEAGLVGNGAMGITIRTRPDAVMLSFGHTAVWDRRAASIPLEQVGTFEEFWSQWKRSEIGDKDALAWVEAYARRTAAGYNESYPAPWPCGTLVLGFDRRFMELLGHRIRLAEGIGEVNFLLADGAGAALQVIPDRGHDRVWLRFLDSNGNPVAGAFNRLDFYPEPWPHTGGNVSGQSLVVRQILPELERKPGTDHAVRVAVRLSGTFTAEYAARAHLDFGSVDGDRQLAEDPNALGKKIQPVRPNVHWADDLRICVQLDHGPADHVSDSMGDCPEPTSLAIDSALAMTRRATHAFWEKCGVMLDDGDLERAWYRCLFLHYCSARPGGVQPGLYGPWIYGKIGRAWHGDYHMNYNAQQTIWGLFSSNHPELHLPYVDMIRNWLPVHQRYTRSFFGLPGAAYTLSLYPEVTPTPPIPSPPWNVMFCVTPWAVQSLWWHYLYSGDLEFLRAKAFEPIKAATEFMNAYMRRPDAHGPGSPWNDAQFHIYPSFVPEMKHSCPLSAKPENNDCLVDLTLTRFLFGAYLDACKALRVEESEQELMGLVREVLDRMPAYVVAEHPSGAGTVFKDVAVLDPESIYNTPNPLAHVFPGEELGLHSDPETLEIARRTFRLHRNEGGNDVVFHSVQGARLGVLDLGRWKRQLRYCELPNGSYAILILEAGGRYPDQFPFDWMEHMGVWSESFAIPFTINECLMQSYQGEIRLFPNWPVSQGDAFFHNLRARGGFLVTASRKAGRVLSVRIRSETVGRVKLVNPWSNSVCARGASRELLLEGESLEFETTPDEEFELMENRIQTR